MPDTVCARDSLCQRHGAFGRTTASLPFQGVSSALDLLSNLVWFSVSSYKGVKGEGGRESWAGSLSPPTKEGRGRETEEEGA